MYDAYDVISMCGESLAKYMYCRSPTEYNPRPNIQRRTNLIVFRAKQRIMSNKASTTLPAECVADFCIVPVRVEKAMPVNVCLTKQIGTVSPSIAPYVEKIEQQLQQGGLQYSVHETGTRLHTLYKKVNQRALEYFLIKSL